MSPGESRLIVLATGGGKTICFATIVVSIVDTRKPNGTLTVTGLTDLYAARLAVDGFHAVSLANQDLVKIWLPDFATSGAVKSGEGEIKNYSKQLAKELITEELFLEMTQEASVELERWNND